MKFLFEVKQEQELYYSISWDSDMGVGLKYINKSDIPMPDISVTNKVEFEVDGDPVKEPFYFKVVIPSKIVKTIEKPVEIEKQNIVEKKIPYNIMAKPQIEL